MARTLEIPSSFESHISDVTMDSISKPFSVPKTVLADREKDYFFRLKSEKARRVRSVSVLFCICIMLSFGLLVQWSLRNQEIYAALHIFETSFNLGEICMTFRMFARMNSCHENQYISSLEWAE